MKDKKTNPHNKMKLLPPGTKRCPCCAHPTQAINRITGYLAYSEADVNVILKTQGRIKNRWQKGKLDELKLRKKHISGS